jgi:hypothetical protein
MGCGVEWLAAFLAKVGQVDHDHERSAAIDHVVASGTR